MIELTGWGRTPRSMSYRRRPGLPDQIHLDPSGRGNLARGMGRSYGDAALNSGGCVWEMTSIDGTQIEDGVVTVGAGTVLADLLDAIVPAGFFVPVTPGTKYVTMGGAVAADVHGKNHHVDGSLGDHLRRIRLIDATGQTRDLHPGEPLFDATVGGMGLTGIIVEVEMNLIPIASPAVLVDTVRTADLDETIAAMLADDHRYRYSVAWLDLLATGRRRGRSVLTRGNHPDTAVEGVTWEPSRFNLPVPDAVPSRLLSPLVMRMFNEAWYRKAPRLRSGEIQSINQFFYPLDMVRDWNRLYGRRGLLQYQVALPDESIDVIRTIVKELSEGRAGSFLVVLKRFGQGRGLLSFPVKGWTLAVDIAARLPGLSELLHRIDHLVTDAGGRTYFAKDARTSPGLIPDMYPELERWRSIVDMEDPDHMFQSDLDRRLKLRTRS